MRKAIRNAYKQELALAGGARARGDLDAAVTHLERAHILGQRYLLPHLSAHWRLLGIARERSDQPETLGQIIRLAAVLPGYLSGWVPKGNTGSAKVSALRPMAPPPDLAPLVADHSVLWDVAVRLFVFGSAAAIYRAFVAKQSTEVFGGW